MGSQKNFQAKKCVLECAADFGSLKIEVQTTGQVWGYFFNFGAPEGSQKDNNQLITWNMIVFGHFALVWGPLGLILGLKTVKFWCFYVLSSRKAQLGPWYDTGNDRLDYSWRENSSSRRKDRFWMTVRTQISLRKKMNLSILFHISRYLFMTLSGITKQARLLGEWCH